MRLALLAIAIAVTATACSTMVGEPGQGSGASALPPSARAAAPAATTPVAAIAGRAEDPGPRIVTIEGCCTVALPKGATMPAPDVDDAIPIDGFRQLAFARDGEEVRVVPLRGAHGWLDVASGAAVVLAGLPARRAATPDGGQRVALPVRRVVDGRSLQMTVSIETGCAQGGVCRLFEEAQAGFRLVPGWMTDRAFDRSSGTGSRE